MERRQKLFITGCLLTLLIGLAAADALLVVKENPFPSLISSLQSSDDDTDTTDDDGQGGSSSSTAPVGVAKKGGPDIVLLARSEELAAQDTDEMFFITEVIPSSEAAVDRKVILKDNDRAGAIAWVDSPKVKIYFLALKEALHSSFTPAVRDLQDVTERLENRPPRNVLTFIDPGISEERILFVRIRERLYEIRIGEGKDEAMQEFIDRLTK